MEQEIAFIDAAEAVSAVVRAQVALAERATLAGVREWADNRRAWVEQNRCALSAAVAAR